MSNLVFQSGGYQKFMQRKRRKGLASSLLGEVFEQLYMCTAQPSEITQTHYQLAQNTQPLYLTIIHSHPLSPKTPVA